MAIEYASNLIVNLFCLHPQVTRKVDHETGLHNVRYSIEKSKKLEIDDSDAIVYNVRLECDKNLTPWCVHKKQSA